MTSIRSNIAAHAALAAAESTLKANIGLLRHYRAEPTATQIAAVVAVTGVIVIATKQQAGWAKLRLIALRELGKFLLRTPYLKGRPPKVSTADTLPSLKKLGIKDRRIAWRAIQVAHVDEDLFQRYLMTDEPTEKRLLRHALSVSENYSEAEVANVVSFDSELGGAQSRRFTRGGYLGLAATGSVEWYTPTLIFKALGCRFDLDVASPGAEIVPWIPADRHFTAADNGLERDWGDAFVWCNSPFSHDGLPQWMEKFRRHGNGIAMIGDRTSMGVWQDVCGNADLILFVNKKINFISPTSGSGNNTLGSTLVAYGERGVQALMNAARAGLGTLFKPCSAVPISSHRAGPWEEDVDAYMTDPSVGKYIVAVMETKITEEGIPADDLWWLECCAGSGNILQHMPPDRRLGIDINPLAPGILRADFFRYELDPTVPWVMLTNPDFSDDGPTRIFNRAAAQNVRLIGLVVPAHLRTDRAQWVNRLDPFYECIHDELLPKNSFLRNGKPHDVPARFQIWVRRESGRQPLKERTEHPDLIWVPKSRSDEATIWICRRGPDIGDIIEAIGITTPPEDYYGIRCSADAVMILRSIRWRNVLDPLPVNHAPNMSHADIVRAYVEAAETARNADHNDHATAFTGRAESRRQALNTEYVAEPPASTDSGLRSDAYRVDFQPDRLSSSVIPSTSPRNEQARKFTDVGSPERCETQALPEVIGPRYIHYDDPYHSFGGGMRICKYPPTKRFIANVEVPLDFDLGTHLEAMFGPKTNR